jgi:hypothetical protein
MSGFAQSFGQLTPEKAKLLKFMAEAPKRRAAARQVALKRLTCLRLARLVKSQMPKKVVTEAERKERTRRYNLTQRSSPKGKINNRMSVAIHKMLRTGKAQRKWENLVGYSAKDLMARIESQFERGMNWKNIGRWHIDHILPRASFNFNSAEDIEFKRCWALENLRPLWAGENTSKGDRIMQPSQISLGI